MVARIPLLLAVIVLVTILVAACSGDDESAPPKGPGHLTFNQQIVEGLTADSVDFTDVDAVFTRIFEGLPNEVTVYPSENYYYFILHSEGRQVWGNIRLAAGSRENGALSFAYFEFLEFPGSQIPDDRIFGSKFYTDADGVVVREADRFTYTVHFRGRTVTFHLHELEQRLPESVTLGPDEQFIERTFDESGYQFVLLFNTRDNYFFWVLDEEEMVPDTFDLLAPDLLVGRRSGFAFWVDTAHGDRKVLAGVRSLNVRRNDYFDGPFDQLADNYAEEVRIMEFIERAFPALQGRIDTYGYYVDRDPPLRVAISAYYVYPDPTTLVRFLELARDADDPYAFISRGGRTVETTSGD